MRRAPLALLSGGLSAFAGLWAATEPARAEPRAYTPAPAVFTREAGSDAGLRATIARLRTAVAAHDMATLDGALAPDFAVIACSTNPTAACAPGAKGVSVAKGKNAAERLRAGLCCAGTPKKQITEAMRVETALGLVGAALADDNIGASPALSGSACLPAPAAYDPKAVAAIVRAADVDPQNLRVTTADLVLLQKPDDAAPEAARVPAGRIVALATLGQEGLAAGWTAAALPQGGVGFTRQLVFDDLVQPTLCFVKGSDSAWKIKLIIERKDAE